METSANPFSLIDWFVALPDAQELVVRRELEAVDEEDTMAYVTSWERIGRAEGQRGLLRTMIARRFGSIPAALDQRIASADQAALETIADRILTATTLADLLDDAGSPTD